MSIYLHDVPLSEAQTLFREALQAADLWRVLGREELPLDEQVVGRVLAEPVWAKLSSPHYHASAMDGFAVRSWETNGATLTAPRLLRYDEQTVYLDTGDPLPNWADAVIPIENSEPLTAAGALDTAVRHPHTIRIREAVPPWKHVRPMGEDIVATELVLPAGHRLRPIDLGVVAGCGHHTVWVARRPRVAILPTGSELKPIGEPVRAGEIIEYNSLVLAGQINEWGGLATRWPVTPDDLEQLCQAVRQAAETHDLILLNAGSSAGAEDFSAQVIATLGRLLVHGVAVRPGHPVILGLVDSPERRPVPILGVPGYPVSAAFTGEIFVEPVLAQWLGRRPHQRPTLSARTTRKIVSPAGSDDYVRVVVGRVGERTLATPLKRGAGVMTSLVRADGVVIFPATSQGQDAGTEVTVHLYRPPAEIDQTVLAIGSHDIALDLLAQFIAQKKRRFVSVNVGSLAGLIALQRGEAHVAGTHLLDPSDGTYNIAYIQRYLPDVPVVLLALVGREQGLFVPKGNPKAIESLADLGRGEVHFVNRQRGAGTRLLLDYHLQRAGLNADQISGYDQTEYTHLAVAAAVSSGRADCGLGIAAAAQALQLDFIPLFQERYDLLIPAKFYEDPLLQPLRTLLQDKTFRRAVAQRPGYDVSVMGQVIYQTQS